MSAMEPNKTKGRMPPPPDKVRAKDGTVFNPNGPAPRRDPVPDRRPHTLMPEGIQTAEQWGNLILSVKNGNLTR